MHLVRQQGADRSWERQSLMVQSP